MQSQKLFKAPGDYTVGWICALPVEHAAATAMLDAEHESIDLGQNDGAAAYIYAYGSIGQHNVVIASFSANITGSESLTLLARSLHITFPDLRCSLAVGIGSGVPGQDHDIRLGDVIVSSPSLESGGSAR